MGLKHPPKDRGGGTVGGGGGGGACGSPECAPHVGEHFPWDNMRRMVQGGCKQSDGGYLAVMEVVIKLPHLLRAGLQTPNLSVSTY